MIDKNKKFAFAAVFGVVLALTGWLTLSLTCAQEPAFDYAHMQDAVLIQLDDEPQLQSPIRTFVKSWNENYTLFFKDGMNKESVEQAIKRQADLYTDQHNYAFSPTLLFKWSNDQELHVTAQVQPDLQKPGDPDHSYVIDVSGAHTKSGQELNDAPNFTALLAIPKQLWRVSADGVTREYLTVFKQPYDIKMLDEDGRYLLLSRYTEYCGCYKDQDYQKLYTVYDTSVQKSTVYPLPLETEYTGPGNFMIDKRGFFYMEPPPNVKVPNQGTVVPFDVEHHVHGAAFSKDHQSVVIVVENDSAEDANDFIVYNLESGKKQVLSMAVRGKRDETLHTPIRFIDDGDSVYFTMEDPDAPSGEFRELGYQYSWKTGQLKPWHSPVKTASGVFMSASSDRTYRVYPNGGIYKGTERVTREGEIGFTGGEWLPGTHSLADIYLDDTTKRDGPGMQLERNLILYDADHHRYDTLLSKLPHDTNVVGASSDGKWIYLSTNVDLSAK